MHHFWKINCAVPSRGTCSKLVFEKEREEKNSGAPARIRTNNLVIMRQQLYRSSIYNSCP